MPLQFRCNIADFGLGKPEDGIILKVYFGAKPDIAKLLAPVPPGQVLLHFPRQHIFKRETSRFKIEGNLCLAFLDIIEPKMVIGNTSLEIKIGTVDHPGKVTNPKK